MKEPLPVPYVHQHYPKFKFHATDEPRIVNTPEQEAALGEGWFNSPADVFAPAPVAKQPVEPVPAVSKKASKA
jgi:hypothetical protein